MRCLGYAALAVTVAFALGAVTGARHSTDKHLASQQRALQAQHQRLQDQTRQRAELEIEAARLHAQLKQATRSVIREAATKPDPDDCEWPDAQRLRLHTLYKLHTTTAADSLPDKLP